MTKGRQLESAIGLACKFYQRAGRADIHHNATPTGRRENGEMYYRRKADADFEGPLAGGGSAKFEAKEVHRDDFQIFNEKTGLKPHQREALERAAKLGALAGVIIGYMHLLPWEIYLVPIVELVPFLDKPFRESVSPDMCRAWGQLLPLGVNLAGKPLVKFLDGGAHPDKDAAIARVNAERLAASAQPSLFGDDGVRHPYEEDLPKRTPVLDRLLKDDPLSPTALRRFARKRGAKTGWWGR